MPRWVMVALIVVAVLMCSCFGFLGANLGVTVFA